MVVNQLIELQTFPSEDENTTKQIKTPLPKLISAVKYGRLDVVTKILEDACIDPSIDVVMVINEQTPNGSTALMWASLMGRLDIVYALLQYPFIDLNLQTREGYTALMAASVSGHTRIVEALLQMPVNINITAKTRDGMTALSLASEKGHEFIVKLLVARMVSEISQHFGL